VSLSFQSIWKIIVISVELNLLTSAPSEEITRKSVPQVELELELFFQIYINFTEYTRFAEKDSILHVCCETTVNLL
jgi:hypothetical protein